MGELPIGLLSGNTSGDEDLPGLSVQERSKWLRDGANLCGRTYAKNRDFLRDLAGWTPI